MPISKKKNNTKKVKREPKKQTLIKGDDETTEFDSESEMMIGDNFKGINTERIKSSKFDSKSNANNSDSDNDDTNDSMANDDMIDNEEDEDDKLEDDEDIDDEENDENDENEENEENDDYEDIVSDDLDQNKDKERSTKRKGDKCLYEDVESDQEDYFYDIYSDQSDNEELPNDIISADMRITKPVLYKYERVRLISDRTKQLALGAKPMIKGVEGMPSKEIALLELQNNVIPLIIERVLPNNKRERWLVSELIH